MHDENARLMGGVAGHAGLFASAADLARFAAWWVSADDAVVPAALRRAAASCQTEGLGGRRGYGWTCPGDAFDILGGRWPPTAVSHTGFTGTSLAFDSPSGVWAVLLTNSEFKISRTLPRSSPDAAHSARNSPAPTSMAVCASWPQAWHMPEIVERYGTPFSSSIGSASRSARRATRGVPCPMSA